MSFSATTVGRSKRTVRRSCSGDSNFERRRAATGKRWRPDRGIRGARTDVWFEELWAHMSFDQMNGTRGFFFYSNGWRTESRGLGGLALVGEENGESATLATHGLTGSMAGFPRVGLRERRGLSRDMGPKCLTAVWVHNKMGPCVMELSD